MVRRSIFMPQRSRAGTDASAHVGHAPRLLGRRGGIDVSNKGKDKVITDCSQREDQVIPECYINLAKKLAEHGCSGNAKKFASLIISIIKE